MKKVIMTRGRYHDNHVLRTMPAEVLKDIHLYCHEGELAHYKKFYDGLLKDIKEYKGDNMSKGRDFIIADTEDDLILFIDDNVNFYVRNASIQLGEVNNSGIYKMQKDCNFTEDVLMLHYRKMFNQIEESLKLENVGMCGISSRAGNNRVEEDYVENTRLYAVWGIDIRKYEQIKEKFSDVIIRQDFYIALSLMTAGFKNRVFYNYCFEKKGGANQKGGCSIYRTPQVCKESAIFLSNKFRPFVQMYDTGKTWTGFDETLVDVKIQWKKLFNYYNSKSDQTELF